MILLAGSAGAAHAQTGTSTPPISDPYTGTPIPVPPGLGIPGLSLTVDVAAPGERVRVLGCLFNPGVFLRITVNPGDRRDPGRPCPGAPGSGTALGTSDVALAGTGGVRQVLQFEELAQTSPTVQRCPFNRPLEAEPPDTRAGGGIGATRADFQGCVDVFVTIPANLTPGQYELCGVPAGQATVCDTFRVASSSSSSVAGRGFARTGLTVLPWVLGAIAALLIGRELAKRSRRPSSS